VVQFHGLGYYTEQNTDGLPTFVHCSLQSVGVVRPHFGGVRKNSEIQRLMSIRMDGNQALNFAILTENSEINCKFLSIRTENSIYICV